MCHAGKRGVGTGDDAGVGAGVDADADVGQNAIAKTPRTVDPARRRSLPEIVKAVPGGGHQQPAILSSHVITAGDWAQCQETRGLLPTGNPGTAGVLRNARAESFPKQRHRALVSFLSEWKPDSDRGSVSGLARGGQPGI